MKKIFFLTVFLMGIMSSIFPQNRIIDVNVNQVRGPHDKFFRHSVGSGYAALGLRQTWQEHLKTVREECGFEYVRFHGIFHDNMRVFDYLIGNTSLIYDWKIRQDREWRGDTAEITGNKVPVYNFMYIDILYDAILDAGMKPFVELGFMPQALASGESSVFWWRGLTSPPSSYEEWAGLIEGFVKHLEKRYGEEEIKTWFFEVWNEPNGSFWKGTQAEYFMLYKYTAEAIKSVNPEYRVGGPATGGGKWLTDFIEFCRTENVPVDFITTHTYGTKGGFFDELGTRHLWVREESDRVSVEIDLMTEEMAASSMPHLPIYMTEWNSSFSPRDPVHDHYFNAAYILDKVKKAEGKLASFSYWTFSDMFEESGPPNSPFHGGFGLINLQGIKKPSFFSYKYLNALGDTELVNTDPLSWVCKNNNGIQILLWDYSQPVQGEQSNQVFYVQDIPAKPVGEVDIKLRNLRKGKYTIQVFQTGYRQNDPYADYYDMGRPSHLTREEVARIKLKNSDAPVQSFDVSVGKDGLLKHNLKLRENDVYFLTIKRK
jgi:xylan 1,4-beta-xylosidase